MARQKTRAGENLSRLMINGYMDLHKRAKEGAFVVWIAIIVPAEIFLGFDNVVYGVPESHAAMCAGKGLGADQAEKAELRGYSTDICSYARIDLGTVFDNGKGSPTSGLPRPNLIISDNNNCSLLVKWFDIYHRMWNIPHFILDVPFCYEEQKEKDLRYIIAQYRDLIETIEKLSGQKFDIDKVREAVSFSNEAHKHWKRFLSAAEHKPAGITAFDSFVHMAPALTLRGTPEYAEHYRMLADETEERLKNREYPVANERYRLLWDNIAPWHQLNKMSSRLAEHDATIISASYTYCLGSLEGRLEQYDYSGDDPLTYLARVQNFSVCPHGLKLRSKSMKEAIKKLAIDGVVFASNRSCKVFSLMQMDQQRIISQDCGVPAVMIDVDHADSRKYSEENTFVRLEALIENIDAARSH